MKVRVTDDATEDLRHIKAFIGARDTVAADGVTDRIRRTLALLATLPRLGHAGIVHGTYEINIPRVPFLVVYRVDVGDRSEELVVLRVYHAAQDRSDAF
jgi:plasmid stabilization system protein ParE